MNDLPVVILCGGKGTRLREETEYKPKPMVEIGGRPIVWHIMKIYAHYGFKNFTLCLGYKGNVIRDYFLNYQAMNSDVTLSLGTHKEIAIANGHPDQDFKVTLAETGLNTMTGGRIKRIEKYIQSDTFMVTYGDGLADVNIAETLTFHHKHGKIATLVATRPPSRYGILDLSPENEVNSFREKAQRDWINGGFFIFNRSIFDYLTPDCVLEQTALEQLADEHQLMAYCHNGFWIGMDTFREYELLNQMWDTETASWAVWQKTLVRHDIAQAFSDARDFSALDGSNLLITGGTGFLGTWLLEALAYLNDVRFQTPCQVYILTRDPAAFARKTPHLSRRADFHFISGDVRSFRFSESCNYVIHAATPTDRKQVGDQPLQLAQTIVGGTQRVLDIAAQKQVKRVLFVSSGAVYGVQPPDLEHISESYAGAPLLDTSASVYGEAKRLAEVLCSSYREKFGFPICIARPFTFVGAYQLLDAGFAVTDLIRDGLDGKPLHVKSDGSAVRSYCYGADAARWLLTILLKGQSGAAYNVGSDEAITIGNLARRIAVHLQSRGIETDIRVEQPPAGGKAQRYLPDVSRAQNELGLERSFDLDQALENTIGWYIQRRLDEDSGH